MSDLTEAQRVDRARRAEMAFDEFFRPVLDHLRATYTERMVEVATGELNPARRADKITSLAGGVVILDNFEANLLHYMQDGKAARSDMLRAERIEKLTPAKRRLLNIGIV